VRRGIAGDAVRKAAPLEVIGDLVLEPGGRAELPLGKLLLQPIASDLAKRLQTAKSGADYSRIENEKRRLAAPGRQIRWIGEGEGARVRYLSGRRGRTRHGGGFSSLVAEERRGNR
jgi:hypothetical protein